jgi:ATP-dependent RNA helicase SUPV3L1/SUV3
VFGALDIYHHAALKPAAAKWRAALFAARDGRAMPELPPESAVHLKEWKFATPAEARNAGYRRIGNEYVRIDLAERVIKKAHEMRGQGNVFGMDMAFATSLGISEAGLKALMRDAGFRSADAPVVEVQEEISPRPSNGPGGEGNHPQDNGGAPADLPDIERQVAAEPAAPPQPIVLTYWRWIGLPKPRPPEQRKPSSGAKTSSKPDRAPSSAKPSSSPSALALQLAALKGLKL